MTPVRADEGKLEAVAVESGETLRFGRVRRTVWLALAAAVLLAALLPMLSLWRSSTVALAARGCVWPASPSVGQTANLYIVLDNSTDRAAAGGPWSHVSAQWDMMNMAMGAQQREVSGARDDAEHFAVPLQLDMAGRWWIKVTLQTPGRPSWSDVLHVDVQPLSAQVQATDEVTPLVQQTTAPDEPCGPSGGGGHTT
jgi:hypothetical protein